MVALYLKCSGGAIEQTPFGKLPHSHLTQGHVVGRNILWPALGAGLPAGCRLFGDGRADSGSPGRAWFVPAALMWSLGRCGNAKLVAGDWFAVPSF